jgi:hypothetical protein
MIAEFLKRVIPARYRPIGYLFHLTYSQTGGRVRAGCFKGVKYVKDSVGSAYIPKLLGIYENELFAEVESICQSKPALIVDIGAAEGYYAVGLAVRNPQANVIAFEVEPKGQAALLEMTKLNEVTHRVEVRGKCEPADLSATLGDAPRPIVVCDVEGYEDKLLDPQAVPALAKAAILVELHDFIIPGITEELKRRFAATHRIKHIWQQPRSRSQFPWRTLGTALLPKSYLDWSVNEWRPVQMAWLWMEPHG